MKHNSLILRDLNYRISGEALLKGAGIIFAPILIKELTVNTKYSLSTIQTPLSKSLLAGLGSGIVATMVNLVFNYAYRSITGLTLHNGIINIETIIFFSIITCTVAGLLFHF
jgi:hypothetical protein